MSSGARSGDPDKRAEYLAALEWGYHPTLGAHLYGNDDAVTAADTGRIQNRQAARARVLKTYCLRGHAFTPANTYITPDGHRQCRACKNDGQQRRAQARKESDR